MNAPARPRVVGAGADPFQAGRPLRVLVLAPHPDDFDAIAVTLRRAQDAGHALALAVLTSGASGVQDAFCAPQPPTHGVKQRLREAEQLASCALFGLPAEHVSFLALAEDESGHVIENAANAARVQAHVAQVRPDVLFLPHGNDTNADHQRVFRMARVVVEHAGWPIAAWYNRDPKTVSLRIDAVTPFGEEEAAWKAALLRCHRSQHERNLRTRGHGLDERMLRANSEDARRLGLAEPCAEVFEIA